MKQIMSKLPVFTNGRVHALARNPVLTTKAQQHLQFRKYIEELIGGCYDGELPS